MVVFRHFQAKNVIVFYSNVYDASKTTFWSNTDDDRSDMLSFVSAKFLYVSAFTKHHNKNVV